MEALVAGKADQPASNNIIAMTEHPTTTMTVQVKFGGTLPSSTDFKSPAEKPNPIVAAPPKQKLAVYSSLVISFPKLRSGECHVIAKRSVKRKARILTMQANDNMPPSIAARVLRRGVIIGFLIAFAARLGWAAGGWIIG